MSRATFLGRLATQADWDMVVVGGGATGLGVALDAAARGFSVALVEAHDFAKGTSSRATKLVHGGVRYLAQGNVALVRESLRERAALLANAPHLAQPIPFLMPAYRRWHQWFYGAGLVAYELLSGSARLGQTEFLHAQDAHAKAPGLKYEGLLGGVKYWDGQFDDARLAIAIARTAIDRGACAMNYCKAVGLLKIAGKVSAVLAEDVETGQRLELRSRCVVNATGVWVDAMRRLDHPQAPELVTPSQGVHLVTHHRFLSSHHALLFPRTSDGRVLFAIPWMGKALFGTTDTPRADLALEPEAFDSEVDFILSEAARYLAIPPTRRDVLSVWVGLRPLVKPVRARGEKTRSVSREHAVVVSESGLVSVTGGKWTTYRAMAEDVLDACFERNLLKRRPGMTQSLRLVGSPEHPATNAISAWPGLHLYGSDAATVLALPGADRELVPGLTEAMVRFAARYEFARSVEDVLARRSRLLFLDAALASSLAGQVAAILKDELGAAFDADRSAWEFQQLALRYQLPLASTP